MNEELELFNYLSAYLAQIIRYVDLYTGIHTSSAPLHTSGTRHQFELL